MCSEPGAPGDALTSSAHSDLTKTEKRAQRLRMLDVLSEDLSSILSVYIDWLTTYAYTSLKEYNTIQHIYFASMGTSTHMWQWPCSPSREQLKSASLLRLYCDKANRNSFPIGKDL